MAKTVTTKLGTANKVTPAQQNRITALNKKLSELTALRSKLILEIKQYAKSGKRTPDPKTLGSMIKMLEDVDNDIEATRKIISSMSGGA